MSRSREVQLTVSSLRNLFNSAIGDGILKENPEGKLGKLYRHAGKLHDEIQLLTREVVRFLLGAVRRLYPEHYLLFLSAIHTGMKNVSSRYFFKSLEKAKLRKIQFQELRHTFASLHIQDSQSLVWIKEQLGHSTIKMTVDVYGHLVPGVNRGVVNRLPSLLSQ